MATFEFLQLTEVTPHSKIFNIEGYSNLSGSPTTSINGIPSLGRDNRIATITFDNPTIPPTHKIHYTFNNIIFSGFQKDEITTLKLGIDNRAKIAINDTTFPPPPVKFIDKTPNVMDISQEFSISRIKITKNMANFNLEIDLLSTDSDKFETKTPECKLQDVTLSDGEIVKVLLLYPQKIVPPGGVTIPNFDLLNANLTGINSDMGLPILVVEGDPTEHAHLPSEMIKKGAIWIV